MKWDSMLISAMFLLFFNLTHGQFLLEEIFGGKVNARVGDGGIQVEIGRNKNASNNKSPQYADPDIDEYDYPNLDSLDESDDDGFGFRLPFPVPPLFNGITPGKKGNARKGNGTGNGGRGGGMGNGNGGKNNGRNNGGGNGNGNGANGGVRGNGNGANGGGRGNGNGPNGGGRGNGNGPNGGGRGNGNGPNGGGRGNGNGANGGGRGNGNGANGGGRGNGNGQGSGSTNGKRPCGPQDINCVANYIEELGLQWSRRVQNGTGVFLRGEGQIKKYLPIGNQEPNERFGSCTTPSNENGFCRHLEHCVLEEFKTDFITFIQYSCTIPYGGFVGVCCPNMDDNDEGKLLPSPPSGTGRTTSTTRSPNRPRTTTVSPPVSRSPPTKSSRKCGSSEKLTSRIVGGRIADPKAWKWMAALLRSAPDASDVRSGQYCGGVLISEFHVLTAAHCVDSFQTSDVKIRIGEYDFSKLNETTSSPKDFSVTSIKIHENFNRYSYQNDIALVKLDKSAYFDDRISNICLPPDDDELTYENEVGIVTGWGTIYYGGPTSNTLMEVIVPVWKQDDCKAAYTQPIEDTNLCAGVRSGSRDSCQGDSGGPLQLQVNGLWRIVGIVSWGIRCAEPGYPGVYTRVSKYLDWIDENMTK